MQRFATDGPLRRTLGDAAAPHARTLLFDRFHCRSPRRALPGDGGRAMSGSILYLVSRYPKVTETFVVNELLAYRAPLRGTPCAVAQDARTGRAAGSEGTPAQSCGLRPFASMATAACASALARMRTSGLHPYPRRPGSRRSPTHRALPVLGVFLKAVRLASMSGASRYRACACALRQPSGNRSVDRPPPDRGALQLHCPRQRPVPAARSPRLQAQPTPSSSWPSPNTTRR